MNFLQRQRVREKLNEPYEERMAAAYLHCLERERVDETKHRLYTKQGRFDAAMVRLDALEARDKFLEVAAGRVCAATAEKVSTLAARSKYKLDAACKDLSRHGSGHLVRVLRLIAKYGKCREESIWELMKDDTSKQGSGTSGTAKRSAKSGASRRGRKRRISGQLKKS